MKMSINNLQSIVLGREKDGGVKTIEIDCSEWKEKFPQLTKYRIEVTSPNGIIYCPEVTMNEHILTWPITKSDTALTGKGAYQIVATGENDERLTSAHLSLNIYSIMPGTAQETPPEYIESWVQNIVDTAERAELAAKKAEDAAAGIVITPEEIQSAVDSYLIKNPIKVEETDPTVPDWAKQEKKPTYTAEEVDAQPKGDYALKSDIPAVPVKSVNGKTGTVVLNASDVGAQPKGDYALKSDIPEILVKSVNGKTGDVVLTAQNVGALPADAEIVDKTARDGVATLSEEMARKDKPLVYIDGEIPVTKDNVLAEMRVVSGWLNFHAYIKIKCQGTSSMAYPKKNFTVTLYQDAARTIPLYITIPGWKSASNKFVFKANWIDHSHARNIISARLWSEVVAARPDYAMLPLELRSSPNNGAIDGFPITVYANGAYQGIYTWNIGKDAWMWNMDENNPNHVLMCAEGNTDGVYAETPSNFRALWNGVNGSKPGFSVEVGTNSDALKNSLNSLIQFVIDNDGDNFKNGIGAHLDINSAIDYYLFQYVICGLDGLAHNMLLGTYDGRVWRCGAYDLDATFGLWWNGTSFVSATYRCPEDYQEPYSLLWERIEALYADELKARYAELRASALSAANMLTHFDRYMRGIGAELYEDDLTAYPHIPSSTTNNLNQIRNYIKDRLAYVDGCISRLGEEHLGHVEVAYIESTGTQYIDTGISGGTNASYEIKLNTLGNRAIDYEQYFSGQRTLSPALKLYNHTYDDNPPDNISGQVSEETFKLYPASDTIDHIVKYTKDGEVYVDDVQKGVRNNFSYGTGWGTAPWYVFNAAEENKLASSMRLYYLKMWTDGELVRDFVPVIRNADNVACLYDKVSGEYFVNIGTGAFITP